MRGINSDSDKEGVLVYMNLTEVDTGKDGDTGIAVTSAANYQILAGVSLFTSVGAGSVVQLPETTAVPGGNPQGLRGADIVVINLGANNLQLVTHPNDSNLAIAPTINGVAGATGIAIAPNSIFTLQCANRGNWFSNGVGFAGQIATIASQGTITAHSGGGQTNAIPITQGMVNIGTVGAANDSALLPPAKAGLQIVVQNSAAVNSANIFPCSAAQGGAVGGDQINALGQNNAFALGAGGTTPTVFYCFVNGTWLTK